MTAAGELPTDASAAAFPTFTARPKLRADMAVRPAPFFSSLLPPPGPGRTLRVAGGLLGLCAAGQLAALTWFLARGGARRPTGGNAAESLAAAAVAQPTPDLAPPQPTPLSVAPPAVPAATPPPAPPPPGEPSSTPGLASATSPNLPTYVQPTPAPALTRSGGGAAELIEQAKALRTRGDTQSALARLREAQGAAGGADNPLVIAEMALTFEAMQLPDRASGQWQRLYELGESAGAPYYLAESRLRANGEMPPSTATPDPAGTGRDRSGFQQNALLRILETRVEEQPDASVEKKIALRIVVKNRPGTAIDSRKVKVEAYYYDLLDGKEIVQTDAETGFQWLTPPVDWANDSSEVLETTYLRPKGGPPAAGSSSALLPPPPPPRPAPAKRGGSNARGKATPPPSPPPEPAPEPPAGPPRVYLGYIVRLYYNRQLQDVRAEPEQLLQRFPPPLTLPAEQP